MKENNQFKPGERVFCQFYNSEGTVVVPQLEYDKARKQGKKLFGLSALSRHRFDYVDSVPVRLDRFPETLCFSCGGMQLKRIETSQQNMTPDIPQHIIEAAETVRIWAEQNGLKDWQIAGVCDRRIAHKLEQSRASAELFRDCVLKRFTPTFPCRFPWEPSPNSQEK